MKIINDIALNLILIVFPIRQFIQIITRKLMKIWFIWNLGKVMISQVIFLKS